MEPGLEAGTDHDFRIAREEFTTSETTENGIVVESVVQRVYLNLAGKIVASITSDYVNGIISATAILPEGSVKEIFVDLNDEPNALVTVKPLKKSTDPSSYIQEWRRFEGGVAEEMASQLEDKLFGKISRIFRHGTEENQSRVKDEFDMEGWGRFFLRIDEEIKRLLEEEE